MGDFFQTDDGGTVRLGRELGHGGEGTVHEVEGQPGLCAKIFSQKDDKAQLHGKLRIMVANPPRDPALAMGHHSIAWPTRILYRDAADAAHLAGFVMPMISSQDFKPAISCFFPPDRRRLFGGGFTWRHSYNTAWNISSAVAAIHEHGYCVGDLNESNVLAAGNTLAALIGCDSFQVRDAGGGRTFRCVVGKPEYTAPELIQKSFDKADRTPATDDFALAVLLFQFLMEGFHPYSARGPLVEEAPSIDKKISLGYFPYPHAGKPEGVSPPRWAPPFDILHPELQKLFVRAFVDGHKDPSARPTSREWYNVLRNARDQIIICGANPNHCYFNHLGACPWCQMPQVDGNDPVPAPNQRQTEHETWAAQDTDMRLEPGLIEGLKKRASDEGRRREFPEAAPAPSPAERRPRAEQTHLSGSKVEPPSHEEGPAPASDSEAGKAPVPGQLDLWDFPYFRVVWFGTLILLAIFIKWAFPLLVPGKPHALSWASIENVGKRAPAPPPMRHPEPDLERTPGVKLPDLTHSRDPEKDVELSLVEMKHVATTSPGSPKPGVEAFPKDFLAGGIDAYKLLSRGRELKKQGYLVAAYAAFYAAEKMGDKDGAAEGNSLHGRLSKDERMEALKFYLDIKDPVDKALMAAGRANISWMRIPGGSFMMGDKHRYRVTVRSFSMAKTLVTNGQYRACVSAGACAPAADQGDRFNGEDQPVVGVDWNQASAFSRWVVGRLPSEAEWEYAARSGGREQEYPWGNETATCARAVIRGCGSATAPVCSKPAGNTAQGLCDMSGNSWEWVQDWYHGSYDGAPTDGSAWENPAGSRRVVCGGAWGDGASIARAASRGNYDPAARNGALSFRPVR